MAVEAVANRGVSIALACRTFQISESCYRYERQLGDENAVIAEWLVKLTINHRIWGFGLCFSLTGRLMQGNDREVVSAECERLCKLQIFYGVCPIVIGIQTFFK
jgi:putative transposase